MASAVAVAALLTGCSTENDFENGKDGLASLELSSVSSSDMLTRAVIDGTTFPTDKGNIGLFLFKDELAETPYGPSGYTNVKYEYNSTKSKWTASPSIWVGSTPGHLYGYYPYSATATNVKAIPVKSSLNGDDVMYATKQTVTDATASQTSITMNHALARVSITVKNNGYIGAAKLSEIKFADAKTSLSGSLDATTGAISGTTRADVTLTVPSGNQTITSDGTTYECLLVPSEKEESKQEVKLTLTIDGVNKEATLSENNGVIIAKGTKSNITITLSNRGISVSSVSIDEWKEVEVGGHKVTVKRSSEDGIADDVFLDVTSNGSTVTIKSHSAFTDRRTSCTCTPDGKATCTPSIDAATGICTFTITNVQDDITAEVGYLKYNATVKYDSDMGAVKLNGAPVTSETPVQILHGEKAVFTAEAATGNGFVKWTDGNDKYLSTDNPYTVSSVTSDITLKAIFVYEIAAEVKPAGAGTVTGAGNYAKGSTATLTATAGGSFAEFVGWAKAESPGTIISKDNPYTFTVSQSASYVAVFKLKDALSGVFTVAADYQGNPMKKVQFSKGNLYCSGVEFNENGTVKSMANAQWGFESNQYDTTPSSNGDREPKHISHFMWCAVATNAMALKYEDGWNKDETFFAVKNFTVNGYSGWSTLTGDQNGEWEYLLNKRKTKYGTGELFERNHRYAAVKVNGMAGLLIFPDDFSSWPSGAGNEPTTFNMSSRNWNNEDYTVDQFNTLQENGCVFLPAAGTRDGSNGYANVKDVDSYGYYRSASPDGKNNSQAFNLFFSAGNVDLHQSQYRSYAMSVRLVTEVK